MPESYVTYKSFYDAMEDLTDEQYGRVTRAIDRYVYYGEGPELRGVEKMAFIFMKPQIDANIKRKEAADKGGKAVQKQPSRQQGKAPNASNLTEDCKPIGCESSNPMGLESGTHRVHDCEPNGFEKSNPNVNENENENENGNGNENENGNGNLNDSSPPPSSTLRPLYKTDGTQGAVVEYQKEVYCEWLNQGLPLSDLSRQDFFHFQQRELRDNLGEVMRYSADKQGVLQAIKNAGEVKKLIDTGQSWQNTAISFGGFWKKITQYLPGAFDLQAFRRNSFDNRNQTPPPPPVPRKKRICPACSNEIRSNSNICEHCCFDTAGADDPKGHYQQLQTEPTHEDILLVRQILHNRTCRETPVLQG